LGPARKGNLKTMHSLAKEAKARARIPRHPEIRKPGQQNSKLSRQPQTVGALVDIFLQAREQMAHKNAENTPTSWHRSRLRMIFRTSKLVEA